MGRCPSLTYAACSDSSINTPRLATGEDGSPWLVMTLPDGIQNPADQITEILSNLGDVDRAAIAVYCNALSGYTDTLSASSYRPAAMGLAV